jgi:hypothetical protein
MMAKASVRLRSREGRLVEARFPNNGWPMPLRAQRGLTMDVVLSVQARLFAVSRDSDGSLIRKLRR